MLFRIFFQRARIARLLVAAGCGILSPPGLAQSDLAATNTLALADARQLAFTRNWDLLAAHSGVDMATAQLLVAKEFPNPTFSYSTARIGSYENSTPVGNGLWSRNYDTIFAVNQLIEIGGKRRDRKISAQAEIIGARARFYDARRLLDQGVTKAYVAALLAGENVRVLSESAQLLRHETEIAQARLKAGDISDSDEKQIENNADVFDLQAKSAEAAAVQARIAVEILLGEPQPKGNWTPAESLAQMALAAPPLTDAKTNALRPDVLAAQADLKQSQADLKLQKAMRIPDVFVSGRAQSARRRPAGRHGGHRRFVSAAVMELESRRNQIRASDGGKKCFGARESPRAGRRRRGQRAVGIHRSG